jgi:hypothetical protein
MKINMQRVLLGGLLAGVILVIGEYVLNDVVIGAENMAEFQRLGLPQPGGSFIAKVTIATLILGIMIVYLYALIRSHSGPGVKTAICAGLLAWFFVYLYTGFIYNALGLLSTKVFGIVLVWGAVEYSVAAIAGAWPYKEL